MLFKNSVVRNYFKKTFFLECSNSFKFSSKFIFSLQQKFLFSKKNISKRILQQTFFKPIQLNFFFRRLRTKDFRRNFLRNGLTSFFPSSASGYTLRKFPSLLVSRNHVNSKLKSFIRFRSFFKGSKIQGFTIKHMQNRVLFIKNRIPSSFFLRGIRFLSLSKFRQNQLIPFFSKRSKFDQKNSISPFLERNVRNLKSFQTVRRIGMQQRQSNLSKMLFFQNLQGPLAFFSNPFIFSSNFSRFKRFEPIDYAAFMLKYNTAVSSKYFFFPSSNKARVLHLSSNKFVAQLKRTAVKVTLRHFISSIKLTPPSTARSIFFFKKKLFIRSFFSAINFLSSKNIFKPISKKKFSKRFNLKYRKIFLFYFKRFYARANSFKLKRTTLSSVVKLRYFAINSFFKNKRTRFLKMLSSERGRFPSIFKKTHFSFRTFFLYSNSLKFPILKEFSQALKSRQMSKFRNSRDKRTLRYKRRRSFFFF